MVQKESSRGGTTAGESLPLRRSKRAKAPAVYADERNAYDEKGTNDSSDAEVPSRPSRQPLSNIQNVKPSAPSKNKTAGKSSRKDKTAEPNRIPLAIQKQKKNAIADYQSLRQKGKVREYDACLDVSSCAMDSYLVILLLSP